MTAWYVALLAVVIAVVGLFVVLQLRDDLTAGIDSDLRPAATQIAAAYAEEGIPEFRDAAATVLAGERPAAQMLDRSGAVVGSYGDPVARRPMLTPAQQEEVPLTTTATLDGQDFRVAARPVDGHVAVAAESLEPVERSVNRVLVLLLLALPAALLVTALGGWWLARRALRPVEEITTAAERIGVGELDERVAVPAAEDEVAHLAGTLNTMLARIQSGVEEQRRLVADTSHELRTPLAAMRAELDVSLRADQLPASAREVLESAREEVDGMSRMVDDLLVLAASDDGLALVAGPVDLRDVAARVVAALAPMARAAGVRVEVTGGPAPAVADAERLRHALRNVVENAVKFSPAGGSVEVRVWSDDAEAGVTVLDAGPGIPAELRERVFDRFYRADPSRTRTTGGSGLGLSIARGIAEAHNGRISIDGREPHGCAVTLALPRA